MSDLATILVRTASNGVFSSEDKDIVSNDFVINLDEDVRVEEVYMFTHMPNKDCPEWVKNFLNKGGENKGE